VGEEKRPDELVEFYKHVVDFSRALGVSLDVALMLIVAFELRCIHHHIDGELKKREER